MCVTQLNDLEVKSVYTFVWPFDFGDEDFHGRYYTTQFKLGLENLSNQPILGQTKPKTQSCIMTCLGYLRKKNAHTYMVMIIKRNCVLFLIIYINIYIFKIKKSC